jgi:hypothetical protein
MKAKEINNFPVNEKLTAIKAPIEKLNTESSQERLKKAADLLLSDYTNDKELTIFSSTDF